jgi:hypothetical protein
MQEGARLEALLLLLLQQPQQQQQQRRAAAAKLAQHRLAEELQAFPHQDQLALLLLPLLLLPQQPPRLQPLAVHLGCPLPRHHRLARRACWCLS